jgi:hypothetical protein
MGQKSVPAKEPPEQVVKQIRRASDDKEAAVVVPGGIKFPGPLCYGRSWTLVLGQGRNRKDGA